MDTIFNTYAVCTAQKTADNNAVDNSNISCSDTISDINIPTLGYQCKIYKNNVNEPRNINKGSVIVPLHGPEFSYKPQIIQYIEKYRSRYSVCCDYTTDK